MLDRSALFSAVLCAAACAPPTADLDDGEATSELIGEGTIDPDRVLEDDELFGGGFVTSSQIRDLLARHGSALASYVDPTSGLEAPEAILRASGRTCVHPGYLLARIEGESLLVSSGSLRRVATATGCACPDGGACQRSEAGFTRQVDCAADLVAAYLRELDEGGRTRSGWQVGVTRRTLDGCAVTPRNRATAVLYTYTPHVGAFSSTGCGDKRNGGTTRIGLLTRELAGEL
jgi:hypothetical protein